MYYGRLCTVHFKQWFSLSAFRLSRAQIVINELVNIYGYPHLYFSPLSVVELFLLSAALR